MSRKLTVLVSVLIFMALSLSAHSPSEMELSFDFEEMVLTLTIVHEVGNTETHYVDQVTIRDGRNELIVQKLSSQENETGTTLSYRIPDAKPGMQLTILAGCNRVGRLTRNITLQQSE